MDKSRLKDLLNQVQNGELDIQQALEQLKTLPFENLGHTCIDNHRDLRQGIPEVVYCESKTPEQVIDIFRRLYDSHGKVLGTRASQEMANIVKKAIKKVNYNPVSRLLTITDKSPDSTGNTGPFVLIISAGTSDMNVAEEAAQTLEFIGIRVERAYDIGVAGIHRLFDVSDRLFTADAIICVAGMEGALTSVVGGLVNCPVIGVPTSVGYGTSLGGFAPLLTMLNSCATGVAIVNIDNGFGAAAFAASIIKRITKNKGQ